MKKLITIDIDGTAIDSPTQKMPTKRLIEAVSAIQSRYYICAATGRSLTFAADFLKNMELIDPSIVAGGTSIVAPQTGKILWQQAIDASDLSRALNIMRDSGYSVLADDSTEDDYLSGGWSFAKIAKLDRAYFLELVFVSPADATIIAEKLNAMENIMATKVVAQRPGLIDIHITHRLATKEHAIFELCDMLGVDRMQSIGIGDGHNDVHIFNAVAYKVAMGNAVIELKEAADLIIGNVKEDGLAAYFEELAKV